MKYLVYCTLLYLTNRIGARQKFKQKGLLWNCIKISAIKKFRDKFYQQLLRKRYEKLYTQLC